jgi:hypothetical protein
MHWGHGVSVHVLLLAAKGMWPSRCIAACEFQLHQQANAADSEPCHPRPAACMPRLALSSLPGSVQMPGCGHTMQQVPCHRAQAVAQDATACSHPMQVCMPLCGHTQDTTCGQAASLLADPAACTAACGATLQGCGHACRSTCGSCTARSVAAADLGGAAATGLLGGFVQQLAGPEGQALRQAHRQVQEDLGKMPVPAAS